VIGCSDGAVAWSYEYDRHGLCGIEGPHGERAIVRGAHGRPVRVREAEASWSIGYDDEGRRTSAGEDPPGWSRDALGRLWTVHDPDGTVVATYVWNGFNCLGRIDGPADEPLAAAFMLDPTGTPVRVVTRHGTRRIPRDAFGEALLAEPGVPGLFGGPVHDGLVRLPARSLDPRTGAFDRLDPLHGAPDDPRRADGFEGLLPVDLAPDGAYAVCRNDPFARSDPSGGISLAAIPLVFSSLTWSSQYNIVNFVFLQLFANLLPALVTTDSEGRYAMRRWFSMEGLASERGGGFGLRFDPVGIEAWVKLFAGSARRFTLHHVFWSPADDEAFGGTKIIRVFAPGADYQPTFYGTLLRAEASKLGRFLLRGSIPGFPGAGPPPALEGWSRFGGTGVATFPGSRLPRFPGGGLHFSLRAQTADPVEAALGPQSGRVVELAAAGPIGQGTVALQARLSLPGTGLGLAPNALIAVLGSDPPELHRVRAVIERDGNTSVRLVGDLVTTAGGLRVRGATPAATSEPLPLVGTGRFDARAPASTVAYAKDEILELNPGPTPGVARRIAALEARVTVGEALPTELRLPWEVHAAQPAGVEQDCGPAGADAIQFGAGQTPPAKGTSILVASATAAMALRVTDEPGATQRTVDRPISALTGPLTWRPLTQGPRLGLVNTQPAGTALVYTPDASGLAPAAGTHVLLSSGADGTGRTVAALDADELVLDADVPAGTASPVTVRRVVLGDPDVSGGIGQDVLAVPVGAGASVDGHTVELVQLSGPGLPTGATPLMTNAAVTGNTARLAGALAATEPNPGAPVAVTAGGTTTAVLVKAVRASVTLNRPLGFTAPVSGLELVELEEVGFTYAADRLGDLRVLVRPQARVSSPPAVFEPTELPRFAAGEPVELTWATPNQVEQFRIAGVEGCVLTLADGPAIPAGATNLVVRRLDAKDPATGGSRIGHDATLSAQTATTSDLLVNVWAPNALPVGKRVMVTDGTAAFPARVTAGTAVEVEWHPPALPGAPAAVDVSSLTVAARVFVPTAIQEQEDLLFALPAGMPPPLAAGPNTVLTIGFGQEVAAVDGRFTAGTVRVPEEPTYELTLHQALVDHEMVHTIQSAIWGPILLSPIPFRGIEEIFEAAGRPFPAALHHVGKTYSVGGIMNLVTTSLLSGIAWLVLKIFFFFKRLFTGQPLSFGWLKHADWLTFHRATLPDASRPTRIQLGTAGQPALTSGDLVEVTDGGTYRRAKVTAVEGTAVDLDAAAPGGGDLQVALLADDDETSLAEHAVMRHTGFGFAERAFDSVFDPWSRFVMSGSPAPGSFADILRRCARDLFGSSSWTLFPFGYFFWDNAVNNRGGGGHMSKMEQSASQESGDLYSPIGRMAGDIAMVGDIVRYWHFVDSRHDTVVNRTKQDAPGVHADTLLRVLPSARADATVTAAPPNATVVAAPAAERPGDQVPDVLAIKSDTAPGAAPATAPRGFQPVPSAVVPVGPETERTMGAYVAFTRPPGGAADAQHRLTTRNNITGAANAVQAQDDGKQTLFYDLNAGRVADVSVTVAGLPVAEGARVVLLRGQSAPVVVANAGSRSFAIDVLRPVDGPVVRGGGADLQAQGTDGVEPAEVVRVYAVDAGGRHTDAALSVHGMNLARELRIPVRRLEVEVTNRLTFRSAPDPRQPALAGPLLPSVDAYVVIPIAPTDATLQVASVTYPGGAPAAITDPVASITVHAPSAEVLPLVTPGVIYRIRIGVNEPPEVPAQLAIELPPGTGRPADLRLVGTLDVAPHFTLDAGSFAVARGAALTLTPSGGVAPGDIVVSPAAGITATVAGPNVQLAVDAGAATGRRTVLVSDAADATRKALRTFTVT
jgi:hypothetical protein